MLTFGERLIDAASERGRLCVGIDPHDALLESWGLSVDADGLAEFSRICVEAFGDTVSLVKPQVAFYERFGARGYVALEATISALRERGALVVADAKRGDIGSTMAGYATAWLDPDSDLSSDAVTVSPYLGYGSLKPILDLAEKHGRGVFVLAATSNPEARQLQDQMNEQGQSIAQQIVDAVAESNVPYAEQGRPGNIGVVIGATLATPPVLASLGGPVLLPGVGAQGATATDVRTIASGAEHLAFPNVSRAILSRGPDVSALREAVRNTGADYPGLPSS